MRDLLESIKENKDTYIEVSESIQGKKKINHTYPTVKVSTKQELKDKIREAIAENGYNCSLNHIDVSEIEDMSDLFYDFRDFNGDISMWEPVKCTNMRNMFYGSLYTGQNGDISMWDVRNLVFAGRMFYSSKYDGDISRWELNSLNIRNSPQMIAGCPLAKNRKHWPKKFR